ncbi:MAG: hypothetical protein J0M17_24645, partial [Planctomycetes bacterium]|nr:hypothetical protein [Planctomycetota bacterium]
QTCPVVDACGGGSLMHRWHGDHGLDAPSVYCPEIFSVLETATRTLSGALAPSLTTAAPPIVPLNAGKTFMEECIRWRSATESRADAISQRLKIDRRSGESAASIILAERHEALRQLELGTGETCHLFGRIKVQSSDERLVAPFRDTIRVLDRESAQVTHGLSTLTDSLDLIAQLNPDLAVAFSALVSDIQFVESTIDAPDHIFSFSDDSAPNVLYVSPFVGSEPLGADDLGDSLLHEFLHQVLYQMEREGPMLHDRVHPHFPAPWRSGLRPSGGFFHGTFVFAGLSRYWAALAESKLLNVSLEKAQANSTRFAEQAEYGIKSLRQFALLTKRGERLLDELCTLISVDESPMLPPLLKAQSALDGKTFA